MNKQSVLEKIQGPASLRSLSDADMKQLACELREKIIAVVSRRGGHLASNLGIAELTIAMHYVFDFTTDLRWHSRCTISLSIAEHEGGCDNVPTTS